MIINTFNFLSFEEFELVDFVIMMKQKSSSIFILDVFISSRAFITSGYRIANCGSAFAAETAIVAAHCNNLAFMTSLLDAQHNSGDELRKGLQDNAHQPEHDNKNNSKLNILPEVIIIVIFVTNPVP